MDIYAIQVVYWVVISRILLLIVNCLINILGGEFDVMRPNFCGAGTKKLADTVCQMIKQADEKLKKKPQT